MKGLPAVGVLCARLLELLGQVAEEVAHEAGGRQDEELERVENNEVAQIRLIDVEDNPLLVEELQQRSGLILQRRGAARESGVAAQVEEAVVGEGGVRVGQGADLVVEVEPGAVRGGLAWLKEAAVVLGGCRLDLPLKGHSALLLDVRELVLLGKGQLGAVDRGFLVMVFNAK